MDNTTTPHVYDDDESMHHHPEDVRQTHPDETAVGLHVNDDDESLHHDGEEVAIDLESAVNAARDSGDRPADQLRGLVSWIVTQLVDEPENVTVEAVERGSSVQVQVRLPESDLGKVIGRGGRIAKSIRTALMIVGSQHHLRVSLDIEGQS